MVCAQLDQTHFTRSGKGETLVFLHGAYIDSSFWEHQIVPFSEHYDVINLDLPSHGKTAPEDVQEYSVSYYTEWVISALDQLGVQRFSVVGLSLGAMIAQGLGARYPDRVRSIVLIGGSVSMQHTWLEKIVLSFIFPKRVAMWLFGQLTTKQFLKLSFMLTWFMRGNQWLGEPYTRQRIRESIGSISRPEIKKIYAAVHTFRKQAIERGTFPVLMINGQYDSPLIHFHARSQKRRLGNRCTIMKVPNTGHGCNYDRPELFNEMVMDWMKQVGVQGNQPPIQTAWPAAS
jgi:pimeloyl-ACP methyl ester carboxylesterase